MKLKKILSIALAVSIAGSLAACGSGSDQTDEKTKAHQGDSAPKEQNSMILTYAEVNPADSLDGQVGSFFKEQVERLTGGSVVIDIQASGVLGAENDVLDSMTTGGGTVDLARISCFALTNYGGKLSALPSVPFTFEDREHYWKFTESELERV